MTIHRNIVSTLVLCSLFVHGYAQNASEKWVKDFPRKIAFLSIGEIAEDKSSPKYSIRADTLISEWINENGAVIILKNPFWEELESGQSPANELSFEVSKSGEIRSNSAKKADGKFWTSGVQNKKLIALGNVKLNTFSSRKIRELNILPDFGYPDLVDFKRLQSLSIEPYSNAVFALTFFPEKRRHVLKYCGDPYFMNKILDLTELKTLSIDLTDNLKNSPLGACFYMMDGINPSLLSSKNLKTLFVNGADFLPVHYEDLEKLDYLAVKGVDTPELLNLMILHHQTNKKIFSAYETDLIQYVDMQKSIIDLDKGIVRTYYTNGEKISEGSFVNRLPHGVWKFWYPDGQLCQERHYDYGKSAGTWVFRNGSDNGKIDTTLVLKYYNGRLIYRMDCSFMSGDFSLNGCDPSDNERFAYVESEYFLYWSNNDSVSIHKTQRTIERKSKLNNAYSDTLIWRTESWKFNRLNWECTTVDFCLDKDYIHELASKGYIGQAPYYSKESEKRIKNGVQIEELIRIIDLQKCLTEIIQMKRNAETDVMEVFDVDVSSISPKYWSCN